MVTVIRLCRSICIATSRVDIQSHASARRREARRSPGPDSSTEGVQGVAQGDGCVASDLSLRLVLVIGLQELGVLLLDLLGILAGRAEHQLLEVVVQVLACLRGHLAVGNPRLQVPDERGSRRGGRGKGAGVSRRGALAGRFVRLRGRRMSRR